MLQIPLIRLFSPPSQLWGFPVYSSGSLCPAACSPVTHCRHAWKLAPVCGGKVWGKGMSYHLLTERQSS